MTRYAPDDRFWVVRDPEARSIINDILYETSLRGLMLQFQGGLSMEENPTIFTERSEAEADAKRRLLAIRVATAIQASNVDATPVRVELRDATGELALALDLVPKA